MDFSLINTVAEIANFLGILGTCNFVISWMEVGALEVWFYRDRTSLGVLGRMQVNRIVER